jgi:ABC-type phosphate transport system substrate-binding protein
MPSMKSLTRFMQLGLAVTLAAPGAIRAAPSADTSVAVIVNQSNSVREMSLRDLEKMLKVEKQYWDDGKKVYLVLQESGSAEKEIIREKLLHMSDGDVKKLMLAKLFRGEITSLPKTLSSRASVVKFVAAVPNAIGYVDVSMADPSVRVLKIDGKAPGDPGYQLSSATP